MSTPRTLVLMRHAKAEPRGAGGDEMRPLSLAGRRQASRAGLALLAADIAPEVVLCSPAIRTRQTADLAITSLGCRGELDLLFPDRLYTAYVPEMLEELAALDSRLRTALVVGHEPTISSTSVRIARDGSDPEVLRKIDRGMQTAACTVFCIECPWSELPEHGGQLVRLIETPVEQ